MMKTRLFNPGPLSAIAITVLAAAGLAACSPDPYPTPVAEAPPPPPPEELAGGYPPPPPPAESYGSTGAGAYGLNGGGAYAPAPEAYAPPPGAYTTSAPVVIAMAPIPNPPETPRRARRPRAAGSYNTAPRYIAPPAPAARARTATATAPAARPAPLVRPAPAARAAATAPRTAAPARPPAAAAPARPALVAKGPTPLTPPARVAPPASPPAPAFGPPVTPKVATAPKTAAPTATASAASNAVTNTAAPVGDRAERLDKLRAALADIAGKGAKLTVPGSFNAGVPADVTLNIPADFAEQVKTEAEKNQLGDAARSVNLTALLSGDGFVVTPDETQSQPLIPGQPTEFKWSVTAQPNARASTLKADLGADLLGDGMETLNLGSIGTGDSLFGFKVSPRVVGAGLLILLVVAVISWLTRGRTGGGRSASARRAARRAVRNDRPFDLDREPA